MTGAVMVLYNPNLNLLKQVLEVLLKQVDRLCLVDNSACDNKLHLPPFKDLDYIPLYKNRGIAGAQNIGIQHLIALRCNYILLADQDSIATPDLVRELKRRHRILNRLYDVAAIGPIPINRHTGKPYIDANDERILRHLQHEGFPFWEAHSIIASFSLIPVEAINRTGLMDERLFIDFVDQEWCWRARYNRQKVFIASDLHFLHEQGRHYSRMGFSLKISTPARLYFQIRNMLWLSRHPRTPASWRRKNMRKLYYKILGYPLFFAPRADYLKSILRGLRDGLFRKTQHYGK